MNDNTQITLRGRIGTEPELRISQKGTQWTRFRVAVPVSFKDKQGVYVEQDPRWYTVRAWGRLAASAASSLKKGDPVVILGHPTAEAWLGKQNEVNSALTVTAHAIGPDLTFTSVRVLRPDKPAEKTIGSEAGQQRRQTPGGSWDAPVQDQPYSGVMHRASEQTCSGALPTFPPTVPTAAESDTSHSDYSDLGSRAGGVAENLDDHAEVLVGKSEHTEQELALVGASDESEAPF